MQNFQWLIKNKVEFQRKTKKTSCKISRGLDFLALKFARDVTYISVPNFQEWSFVLPGIFMGTEHKKNSRVFFKKVCPQTPPPCFFSGIAHSRTIELNTFPTHIFAVNILSKAGETPQLYNIL